MKTFLTLCALLFLYDSSAMNYDRNEDASHSNHLKATHLMRLSMHCYDNEEPGFVNCFATITASPAYKMTHTDVIWNAGPLPSVMRIIPDCADQESETVTVQFKIPKETY